ncbi:MAG: NAD(P)/FAD-dependent oxidoreductase [Actinobacteria bacterium]|nr:NAD(P)/FAD-dependent oxidoreductase [Actinomycetota bacterium]
MGTSLYSPDDKWPRRTIRYFEERAAGGVGLILTSFTRVHDKLATGPSPLTGIYDDRLIPSHAELVEKVHKHGAKIFLQIALHGCKFGGLEAPSSIYSLNYNVKPRELTTNELDYLVEAFIKAAIRGYEAGYDGIEVHGGYSYLIGQMISPALNKRVDKYGGSFEGRMKFPVDIIKGILAKYPDFPVGFKFSAYEWLPGGIDINLGKEIAKYISKTGISFLDVASSSSTTTLISSKYSHVPPIYVPRNNLMPLAEEVKKICPDTIVIANGGINVPEEADDAIVNGKCDMVAIGRALIADPYWVIKAKSGKSKFITPCIRCNICHHQLWLGTPLCCSMNPYVLREAEQYLSAPSLKKRVMVVGAGPAGMRCALTAAKRGHKVTLYEKKPYIGGMMYPASRPKFKDDLNRALDWFKNEIETSNITLKLNTEVTPEIIEEVNPDALVISIGAKPIVPEVPGIDKPHVDLAVNILSDISKYNGEKAVVIGGGEVGCETACYLADNGFKVTIVEIMSKILEETQITEIKLRLTDLLKEKNIEIMTETKLNKITDEGIEVIVPYDTQMGLTEGGRQEGLDADLVAIAINSKPDKELIKMFTMKAKEFHIIGDCEHPARIKEAIESGEYVGRIL